MVWMYWTLAHVPGGQPIGALERAFARATKAIGRLVRRGRRRGLPAA
jgi:lipopolysaccharide export system permease protein